MQALRVQILPEFPGRLLPSNCLHKRQHPSPPGCYRFFFLRERLMCWFLNAGSELPLVEANPVQCVLIIGAKASPAQPFS